MKTAVSLFLLCASLVFVGCHAGNQSASTAEPEVAGETVTIPTNAPQSTSLTVEPAGEQAAQSLRLTGRLVWDENVTARVFTPFAGIVRQVRAEVNEPVRKNMALADIQSADFGQAQADWRKAVSDFRRTERALTRSRELFEHGAAPRKDLESAEAEFANSAAEKQRTEQRLAIYGALADSTNGDFLLPSPVDGILVERNVSPGQEVRPDQMLANMPQITAPLFVITDPSRLWILIDASDGDLPYLQPGQNFTFTTRAFPDQVFTGTVAVVSEFIDPATRTIKVRAMVNNSARFLKAEMFVNLTLAGPQKSFAASVPQRAVFLKGDKHFVFIEEQPGQFARHEVKVGPEQEGHVAIIAGLNAGQRVVTDGCVLLQQILK
jgi:cobalt-zinc-cadmium efflux system membrane fusion protein